MLEKLNIFEAASPFILIYNNDFQQAAGMIEMVLGEAFLNNKV